jgi:hypothetical protein
MTTKSEPMVGGGHRVSSSHEDSKPKKRRPHRLSIQRAKNGGHTVEHTFEGGNGLGYQPPVTHVFGKQDGAKLVQHLRRHLLIQDGGAMGVANGEDEGDEG